MRSENKKNVRPDAAREDESAAPIGREIRPGGAAGDEDDRREPESKRLDGSHDSDLRGEHRYGDAHQTGAEQKARLDRDNLKRRLAEPPATRPRRRRP